MNLAAVISGAALKIVVAKTTLAKIDLINLYFVVLFPHIYEKLDNDLSNFRYLNELII